MRKQANRICLLNYTYGHIEYFCHDDLFLREDTFEVNLPPPRPWESEMLAFIHVMKDICRIITPLTPRSIYTLVHCIETAL